MGNLKTKTERNMETQTSKQSAGELIDLAFKAVAVGMSVAAIVLGALGTANIPLLITLLSIGLFCLAVASMKS